MLATGIPPVGRGKRVSLPVMVKHGRHQLYNKTAAAVTRLYLMTQTTAATTAAA